MAESTRDISGLGLDELKALLAQALEEVARLKAENAELRGEIARLKGLKGAPSSSPAGWKRRRKTPSRRSGNAAPPEAPALKRARRARQPMAACAIGNVMIQLFPLPVPRRGTPGTELGFEANQLFVCIWRVATSVCQLVPAFLLLKDVQRNRLADRLTRFPTCSNP
jgi:hypothetical protein